MAWSSTLWDNGGSALWVHISGFYLCTCISALRDMVPFSWSILHLQPISFMSLFPTCRIFEVWLSSFALSCLCPSLQSILAVLWLILCLKKHCGSPMYSMGIYAIRQEDLHESFLGHSMSFSDFCWNSWVDALVTCLIPLPKSCQGSSLSFSPEYAFPAMNFLMLASFAIWIGHKPKSASTGLFLLNESFLNLFFSSYILL